MISDLYKRFCFTDNLEIFVIFRYWCESVVERQTNSWIGRIFFSMKNKLIQIYLFVCQIYDTNSETCFQRLSNNSEPLFTDQELITIWFFAHLNGFSQKKQMHSFIKNYWQSWFPRLPAYQTLVYRLNQFEAEFSGFW